MPARHRVLHVRKPLRIHVLQYTIDGLRTSEQVNIVTSTVGNDPLKVMFLLQYPRACWEKIQSLSLLLLAASDMENEIVLCNAQK